MLLIDVSGSRMFGSEHQLKQNMITEMAATLAFSVLQNNDKIGVIFYSDKLEKFIPPKKGKKHVLFIIRELLDFQPENSKTDLSGALKYMTSVIKKRCTAFVLSDFIDSKSFQTDLTIANRKHDVVAIQVFDKRETELPSVGLIHIKDAETGEERQIDTSSAKVRTTYRNWWLKQQENLQDAFQKKQGRFGLRFDRSRLCQSIDESVQSQKLIC